MQSFELVPILACLTQTVHSLLVCVRSVLHDAAALSQRRYSFTTIHTIASKTFSYFHIVIIVLDVTSPHRRSIHCSR